MRTSRPLSTVDDLTTGIHVDSDGKRLRVETVTDRNIVTVTYFDDALHWRHRLDGPSEEAHNLDTGQLVLRSFYVGGDLHRHGGPAIEEWWETGQLKSREFLLDGRIHCDEGPALEYWHKNGQMSVRSFHVRGKAHRVGGPAFQAWHENGQVSTCEWFLDDTSHREDGPAAEEWDEGGTLLTRRFVVSGRFHNVDGPADQVWHECGRLALSEWSEHGVLHRLDGPASEKWNKKGRKVRTAFIVDGRVASCGRKSKEAISSRTTPLRLAELATGNEETVAALAACNPHCPEDAQVMWALTHGRHLWFSPSS